ncbi:ABC transporter permease [Terrisporobacter petrolearius]|uniref:ABC transporter permease n=1 Tax=Terrisporobacter petrolearius TaxID=1460447 RepID=UPI001D169CB5|nr:ABC transporter permease [Terrisporobacter petrolearius]MCC3865916.1 ABC transporter permease [Terrisporobacter petrolearius]
MKFKNNNKNIVNKITKSSLKFNRGRKIFVVLAIVLTTFMTCSIFTIGVSLVNNYNRMNIRIRGTTSDAMLSNPKKEQIEAIKNLGLTTSIGEEILVGNVINQKLEKDNNKIFLKYYDKENWEKQITPTISNVEGNYPINEDEVMVSTKALEFLGKEDAKIGEKIKLEYIDEKGNKSKKEFILSGKYKTYSVTEKIGYLALSKDYIKNNDLSVCHDGSITISFKSGKKYNAQQILKSKIKLDDMQEFDYYNDVDEDGKEVKKNLIIVMATIGLFVAFSGYLLIYNIMYISVSKDIHFYGLIKTIGASPKQIKKIVNGQAFKLAIIGIPIGLALGAMVSFGVVPMILGSFYSDAYANAMPGDISFNPLIFISSTIFSILTVSISCRKPAKIASSISPTEALKYSIGNKQKKNNNNGYRKSTNGGKIYKMAYHNVFRDKKRATLVFSSLFMGIMTYLSIYTFTSSLSVENYIDTYISSDFRVQNIQAIDEKMNDDFIKEVENIKGVESVNKFKFSNLQSDTNEIPRLLSKFVYDKDDIQEITDFQGKMKIETPLYHRSFIIGVDDLAIEKFSERSNVKIDLDNFKSGKIALIDTLSYSKEEKNNLDNTITLKGKYSKSLTFKTVKFENDSNLLPDIGLPVIYISSTQIENLDKKAVNSMLYINVDKKYEEEIYSRLNEMIDSEYLFVESRAQLVKEFSNNVTIMNIISTSMSAILILIGVLNFINVMVTSINTRRKELAIMESIGMTKKQIKNMLVFEGGYYAGITTFLVSTFGMAIIFEIAKTTKKIASYAKFVFPTLPVICLLVFIFVICLISPLVVYKYSSLKSITERLREIEK